MTTTKGPRGALPGGRSRVEMTAQFTDEGKAEHAARTGKDPHPIYTPCPNCLAGWATNFEIVLYTDIQRATQDDLVRKVRCLTCGFVRDAH